MFECIPDAERLSQMFQNASSPTFLLGAVTAFASLMTVEIHEEKEAA